MFNLSVMRAADKARITAANISVSRAMAADKTGMGAIIALIRELFEDQ
jgi:hypothetical protein